MRCLRLSFIVLIILFTLAAAGCGGNVKGRSFRVTVGGEPGTISFDREGYVVIEAGRDSVLGTYTYSKDEKTAIVTVEGIPVFLTLDYLEGRITERELYARQAELAQKLISSP